jgi:hypothetical protein
MTGASAVMSITDARSHLDSTQPCIDRYTNNASRAVTSAEATAK